MRRFSTHQRHYGFWRHGPCQEETLPLIAVKSHQRIELMVSLDTFANN
jgi:hypothetical protein